MKLVSETVFTFAAVKIKSSLGKSEEMLNARPFQPIQQSVGEKGRKRGSRRCGEVGKLRGAVWNNQSPFLLECVLRPSAGMINYLLCNDEKCALIGHLCLKLT